MASRRPSVLFINRVYPPLRGATGRVLRDLARAFAEKGWEVTVVTTGPRARREYDGPIRIIRVKAPVGAKKVKAYMRVWRHLFWAALNVPKHDLIVTMTDPPLLVVAGRILARLKGARHIHWCQDLYPDILPALGFKMKDSRMRFYKRLSRRAMKKCDKIVTIGRCMAQKLTHSGIEPGKVAVIPNWPDHELLPPDGQSAARRRRVRRMKKAKGARPFDLLLTDGKKRKFRVLYSGNLGRAHPIETVLDAAEILNNDHPEIEFVFVGDGPNYERLARERSRRRLENIRLLPFQPASRLRELMESGDLHLITMNHQSSGMLVPCKLYAALAVGRPCILVGPEDCETARVLTDFKAGAIVPQGNAEKLAAEIKRFRLNADEWFEAHEGASEAGQVFVPQESLTAWIKRAQAVVKKDAA